MAGTTTIPKARVSPYFVLATASSSIDDPSVSDDLLSGYDTVWSLEPLMKRCDLTTEEMAWFREVEAGLADFARTALCNANPDDVLSRPEIDEQTAQRLVRFFFPSVNPAIRLGGIARPLDPTQLLATQAWKQLSTDGELRITNDRSTLPTTVVAGMLILNQCYGQQLEVVHRRIVEFKDGHKQLKTFYSLQPSFDYVEVEVVGDKPQLSDTDIRKLLSQPDAIQAWLAMLPPAHFRFRGIQVVQATNTTNEISLFKLQNLLMKRESVLDERRLRQMQDVMRDYLSVPDLRLGILALDYPRRRSMRHAHLIRQDILAHRVPDLLDPALGNTI